MAEKHPFKREDLVAVRDQFDIIAPNPAGTEFDRFWAGVNFAVVKLLDRLIEEMPRE